MPLQVVLAALLLVPPGTGKIIQDLSQEVIIDERILSLPGLPENVDQARQQNKPTQASLSKGIVDIEKNLTALYPLQMPLGTSLSVPKDRAEEARFLASLLSDENYLEQEARFLKAWNGWQAALVNTGVSESVGAPALQTENSPERTAEVAKVMRTTSRSNAIASAERNSAIGQNTRYEKNGIFVNHDTAEFDFQNATASRKQVQAARAHAIVAKRQAPELAAIWNPLAQHLNSCAIKLMDYERAGVASDSNSMKALRMQAKILFLERYRSAMWTCAAVWAQTASADMPAPLKAMP